MDVYPNIIIGGSIIGSMICQIVMVCRCLEGNVAAQ